MTGDPVEIIKFDHTKDQMKDAAKREPVSTETNNKVIAKVKETATTGGKKVGKEFEKQATNAAEKKTNNAIDDKLKDAPGGKNLKEIVPDINLDKAKEKGKKIVNDVFGGGKERVEKGANVLLTEEVKALQGKGHQVVVVYGSEYEATALQEKIKGMNLKNPVDIVRVDIANEPYKSAFKDHLEAAKKAGVGAPLVEVHGGKEPVQLSLSKPEDIKKALEATIPVAVPAADKRTGYEPVVAPPVTLG